MTNDLKTAPTDGELPNRGPRVKPADIEAEIVREVYFTAANGAAAAGETVYSDDDSLRLLTFCVLMLRNGFTVTGESACASPENFDAEIGKRIARTAAVSKVWPLLGFRLRDHLTGMAEARAVASEPDPRALTEADAAADLAGLPRPDASGPVSA